MEGFAFWMGFVVLATVVPAIVAFIVSPPLVFLISVSKNGQGKEKLMTSQVLER